jgi:hypothetical protein
MDMLLLSYEANSPSWKKVVYLVVVSQIPHVLQMTVEVAVNTSSYSKSCGFHLSPC